MSDDYKRTKVCRRCRKELDNWEFRTIHSGRDYNHTCVLCEAEKKVAYYQAQVDRLRALRAEKEFERECTHKLFESFRKEAKQAVDCVVK